MYGSVSAADTYHTARGNTTWTGDDATKTIALVRASDYIDGRYRYQLPSGAWASMFRGTKTDGRSQDAEWPRTDATDYEGEEIADDTVPTEVLNATYEAALRELVTPGILSPDFVPSEQAKREKVGPVEVEYFGTMGADGKPANRPVIPAIDEILAPLLIRPYDLPAGFVV